MKITFKLFARYAELTGVDEYVVDVPDGATAAEALAELRQTVSNGSRLPERTMLAVNMEHVLGDTVLADQDELALLPPLAGG